MGEETLDPRSTLGRRHITSAEFAFVEILFHADLRRIGDLLVLGPSSRSRDVKALGRDEPSFARDGNLRPLDDPCVSRKQLGLSWSAERRLFSVTPLPEARRPLACYTAEGEPSPAPLSALPPDSLIAIGNRVLLRLGCGPLHLTEQHEGLLGHSAAVTALREQIDLLSQSEMSVLIRGETGVGKELVARRLHNKSPRRRRPLLALNCAALPEHLVESELFGHARGAFSGAATAREGLFRAANGGTLLLDEIGELPLSVQAKLLRAVQERTVRPLGEAGEVAVDVRLLAATHRPLEDDVAAGRFRLDLFARIESPSIMVPPLRERRLDVPQLFVHLLQAAASPDSLEASALAQLTSPATLDAPRVPMSFMLALLRHAWPRNVRELQKVAHAALLQVARSGAATPPWPTGGAGPPPSSPGEAPAPRSEPAAPRSEPSRPTIPPASSQRPSRDELLSQLEAHDFVQARLATALGVSRTTLDKWLREHGIRRPNDVGDDEVREAMRAANSDVAEAARRLGISVRGLQLRLSRGKSAD